MLIESLKPIIAWLHVHPHAAGVLTFLVAFTESLALIGAIIPGSVTLTAIGTLIGAGILPLGETFIWAILGAFAGDTLSYSLGYYYKAKLLELWPFSHHPQILAKGETFIREHAGKSIFIGRYVGPLRCIIPLVVGMLNTPPKRFLIADAASALVWAPSYMLPGILVGAASLELEPDAAMHFILVTLIVLIILWLLTVIIKHTIRWVLQYFDQKIAALWKQLATRRFSAVLMRSISIKNDPTDHSQLSLFFTLLLTLAAFTGLWIAVVDYHALAAFNKAVYSLLQSIRFLKLDILMIAITNLGDKIVMLGLLLSVTVWLCLKRYWRLAFFWFANGALAGLSVKVLKHLSHLPRPILREGLNRFTSFPSGHTTLAVAILGMLIYILTTYTKQSLRKLPLYLIAPVIVSIILSRLYLGAHWLTDVIAGILLGLCSLLVMILIYRRQAIKQLALTGIIITSLLSVAICWAIFTYKNIHAQYEVYQATPIQTGILYDNWWQHEVSILPLYRHNRFGHPSELLNLQWAQDLATIKQNLTTTGWQTESIDHLATIINHLSTQQKTRTLPLLPSLYKNQKPVLIMTHSNSHDKPLLILRLWPSTYHFIDHSTPLWIGIISYRKIWHQHITNSHKQQRQQLTPPFVILTATFNNSAEYKFIRLKEANNKKVLVINED